VTQKHVKDMSNNANLLILIIEMRKDN